MSAIAAENGSKHWTTAEGDVRVVAAHHHQRGRIATTDHRVSATYQGSDWSIISAATLPTIAPLLLMFLLFPRQRTGIR